ncbi:MAG: hypothetical protein KIT58_09795 [Planctomycetota bacterium]|nr:hypothetical protein [Planctomycetota bacterium]
MIWAALALVALILVAIVVMRQRGASDTPIPRVPHVEGEPPPGPGWTLVQIEGSAGLFWVETSRLQRGPARSELSEAQVARIRRFKARLGDLDPASLELTLDNFSRDASPEAEIAVWERITDVVEEELAARGSSADEHQRRLVFRAVLACANTEPRTDVLLAVDPGLRALADLPRVVERWRASRTP